MRTKPVTISSEGPQFGVGLKYEKGGVYGLLSSVSIVIEGEKVLGWIAACKSCREWLAWRNINGKPVLWTNALKTRQDAINVGFDPNEPCTYGFKSRFDA